eukprot:m.108769 g.108769  ORF g.108769 m.108769 type:complete len:695 (+) comp14290_c0_seq3:162-2246(+)
MSTEPILSEEQTRALERLQFYLSICAPGVACPHGDTCEKKRDAIDSVRNEFLRLNGLQLKPISKTTKQIGDKMESLKRKDCCENVQRAFHKRVVPSNTPFSLAVAGFAAVTPDPSGSRAWVEQGTPPRVPLTLEYFEPTADGIRRIARPSVKLRAAMSPAAKVPPWMDEETRLMMFLSERIKLSQSDQYLLRRVLQDRFPAPKAIALHRNACKDLVHITSVENKLAFRDPAGVLEMLVQSEHAKAAFAKLPAGQPVTVVLFADAGKKSRPSGYQMVAMKPLIDDLDVKLHSVDALLPLAFTESDQSGDEDFNYLLQLEPLGECLSAVKEHGLEIAGATMMSSLSGRWTRVTDTWSKACTGLPTFTAICALPPRPSVNQKTPCQPRADCSSTMKRLQRFIPANALVSRAWACSGCSGWWTGRCCSLCPTWCTWTRTSCWSCSRRCSSAATRSPASRMRSCKLCTPAPASSPSSSSAIRSACHPGWMLRRCLISFCTWTLILCSRHMPQTSPTTRGPSCSTPGKRWLACSARCISPWTMRSLSRSTRSRPLKLRACCASATPSRPPRTSTCCCITCPPFLSATAGPSASSPCRPWRRAWAPTACAGGTAPCATPSPGSLPPLCRCCSATTCCCMRAPEALRSSASPTRPTTRHTPLLALLHCAHIAFRLRDLCTAPWSSPQQPPHCLPRRLTMMTK